MNNFFIILLVVSSALPAAAEVTLRGNVKSVLAFDTQHEGGFEKFEEGNTHLFLEANVEHEEWKALISTLGRFQWFAPNRTLTRFEADLYEAYGRYAKGSFHLEAGQRVIRWGVMEYVSPTDAINPKDTRQMTDPEVEDEYLPVPIVRLTLEERPLTFEILFQPFFRRSRFEVAGTDAALYRPAFADLLGVSYRDPSSNLTEGQLQSLPDAVSRIPNANPLTGEGGARLSLTYTHADFSFLYLTKRETLPAPAFLGGTSLLDPNTPPTLLGISSASGGFPRDHLVGGTARAIFDNGVTLKAETLFRAPSTVYDVSLRRYRKNSITYAIGAEYDFNLTHLFVLEYAENRIFGDTSLPFLLTQKTQRIASAAFLFSFDDRTWTLELKGTTLIDPWAYVFRPRVGYHPTPSWDFSLGANVWGGDLNTPLGLLSNNDEVFAGLKYSF